MFDIKQALKQILAAAASTFPAGYVGGLLADLQAGKAAIYASIVAGISTGAVLVGNLIKQLWDMARGYFSKGTDEAAQLITEAQEKIRAALKIMA